MRPAKSGAPSGCPEPGRLSRPRDFRMRKGFSIRSITEYLFIPRCLAFYSVKGALTRFSRLRECFGVDESAGNLTKGPSSCPGSLQPRLDGAYLPPCTEYDSACSK